MLHAVCDITYIIVAFVFYGSCRDVAAAKGVLIVKYSAPTAAGVNKGRSKERVARSPGEY